MPKQPREYHRPDNLAAALKLLSEADTEPLAGGTKLLAADVSSAVVDLQALGLDQLRVEGDRLYIGAMCRLTNIAETAAEAGGERSPAELLNKAIRQAGPNTYRNAATLGGSIASRLADSELLALLLLLDTELTICRPAESRMSLEAYLEAADRPNGLITEISISWSAGKGGSERVARTPADYPIVSISLWQPDGGLARLSATGLGARPFRLEAAEAALAAGITPAAVEAAAAAAQAASSHPGDFRGDASYRAKMAAVLTRRVCG